MLSSSSIAAAAALPATIARITVAAPVTSSPPAYTWSFEAVSYTHLDVYKRQLHNEKRLSAKMPITFLYVAVYAT